MSQKTAADTLGCDALIPVIEKYPTADVTPLMAAFRAGRDTVLKLDVADFEFVKQQLNGDPK